MNIDPGAGYRLLEIGETIQGDDQWECNGGWFHTDDIGEIHDDHTMIYRRKIHSKLIRLYTTCDDLGVINGAVVYATERDVANDNVREIKVDPSTGTLYVEDGHGRPTGEA